MMQFALDSKWQITSWSDAMEIMSGFRYEEIVGLDFVEDLIDFDRRYLVQEVLDQACRDQEGIRDFTMTFYAKNGSPINLLLNASPVYDSDHKPRAFVIIASRAPQGVHLGTSSPSKLLQGNLVSTKKSTPSDTSGATTASTTSTPNTSDELPAMSVSAPTSIDELPVAHEFAAGLGCENKFVNSPGRGTSLKGGSAFS
jgi:PAS domain S-box-containing protein